MQSARLPVLAIVTAMSIGCGKSDDAGTAGDVTPAPASASQRWATDRAADRAAASATLLAFVNGLHVMVLDGDEAFLGMTRRSAARGAGGERSLTLANGLVARLVPAGDSLELRFSTGESIPMRKQEARP